MNNGSFSYFKQGSESNIMHFVAFFNENDSNRSSVSKCEKYHAVKALLYCRIHMFYKKLRIWASTESFLKLSDFEYSEFLTSFLKVS